MEPLPLLFDLHFTVGLCSGKVSEVLFHLGNQKLYYVPLLYPIAFRMPRAASSTLPSVLRTILIGEPQSIEQVESIALVTSSSFFIASIDTMSRVLVVSVILRL